MIRWIVREWLYFGAYKRSLRRFPEPNMRAAAALIYATDPGYFFRKEQELKPFVKFGEEYAKQAGLQYQRVVEDAFRIRQEREA